MRARRERQFLVCSWFWFCGSIWWSGRKLAYKIISQPAWRSSRLEREQILPLAVAQLDPPQPGGPSRLDVQLGDNRHEFHV